MSDLFYSTKILLKNLKKGQFAQSLENGSDLYEHVQLSKVYN